MRNARLFYLISYCILLFISYDSRAAIKIDTIPGLARPDSAIHFLVVGDWGAQGLPPQQRVAKAMAAAGDQLGLSFVISTGDNFYPSGVADTADPQWKKTFEDVYKYPSLQCRWMVTLGNHDYQANPQAEVDYTYKSTRWYMPARYYRVTVKAGTDSLLLVFLDTEPIERRLRGLPDSGGREMAKVEQQLSWLKETLASSHARFKMVIAHHPLHTGGSRRHNRRHVQLRRLFEPILSANKVDLYLSGHEHHLEYLKPPGPTHFIISGAGSETRHVGGLKRYRRFAARKKGFVSISVSSHACTVQFISADEKLLYRKTIVK